MRPITYEMIIEGGELWVLLCASGMTSSWHHMNLDMPGLTFKLMGDYDYLFIPAGDYVIAFGLKYQPAKNLVTTEELPPMLNLRYSLYNKHGCEVDRVNRPYACADRATEGLMKLLADRLEYVEQYIPNHPEQFSNSQRD